MFVAANLKDRFFVFLSLSFMLLSLLFHYLPGARTPFAGKLNPVRNSNTTPNWKIDQEKALEIVKNEAEVSQFLTQGEIREEDQSGITIRRPKLTQKEAPSLESPFWRIQVFEEVVHLPTDKNQPPTSYTETFNWYQVDALSGELKEEF